MFIPREDFEVQRDVCIYPQKTLRCRELYIPTEDFEVQRDVYTHKEL